MKIRIGQLIGGVVEGMPWLGTFHAIGVKILRRHAELVDLKPSFTVLDTDDQIRLLKQLLDAENIDEKRWPARLLASMIDGWKNRGLTPKRVPEGESFAFANGRARELYALYQKRLKELNAADFGDLLLENLRLFQEHAGRARQISAALSVYAGRRVSGQQRRAIFVAAAAGAGQRQYLLRRRRRPVDLWLARRRGGQHPALRDRFPRRQDHQARAQLPLDRAYSRRGLGTDRTQQRSARQDAAHRWRARRQGRDRRLLGRRGGSPHHWRGHRADAAAGSRSERDRHPGARLVPDARLRGSLHHARPCPIA